MRRQPSSEFANLRNAAWKEVFCWADSVARRSPPAPLHELAAQRRIRRIQVLPLLSTAGLAPSENGYAIYLNDAAPGASTLAKTTLEVREDDFVRLTAPMRFSVAHEIAHVFFLDLVGGDANYEPLRKHWRALENACNQMARILLLPKRMLVREIKGKPLDLASLLLVLKRFRVSAEVLIYRLRMKEFEGAITGQDGALALVQEQNDGQLKVAAMQSWGVFGRGRWPSHKVEPNGRPIRSLYLEKDTVELLAKGTPVDKGVKVFWREGQVIPCRLRATPLFRKPLSVIMTLEVAGFLEKQGGENSADRNPSAELAGEKGVGNLFGQVEP